MTQLSRGIDVASFQSLATIEHKLPQIAFGFVKATEGIGYVNPIHEAQLRTLAHAGKAIGLYHFLRSSDDGVKQWRHFEQIAAPYRGRVLVAVDHEREPHGGIPSPKIARAFIRAGQARGWHVGRYGSSGETMAYVLGESFRWVAQWSAASPRVQWDIWQQSGSGDVDMNVFHGDLAALHRFWTRLAASSRPHPKPPCGGAGWRVFSV